MTRFGKIALSTLVGLSTGGALGLAMANSYQDQPFWLVVLAYAVICGPAIAGGFHLLVLQREEFDRAQHAARHDIETGWAQQAGFTAWAATITILIALSLLGQATRTDWLEHLGTAHVAIVGLGTYAVSYLRIKRQEA